MKHMLECRVGVLAGPRPDPDLGQLKSLERS
jgi:hypothetical protein